MNLLATRACVALVAAGLAFGWHQQRRELLLAQLRQESDRLEVERASSRARAGWIPVLRMNADVSARTSFPPSSLRTEFVPPEVAPPRRLPVSEGRNTLFAREDLAKGEILVRARIFTEAPWLRRSPENAGHCYYRLDLPCLRAVSGFLRPGDRVDVLAMMTSSERSVCRIVCPCAEVVWAGETALVSWHLQDEESRGNLGASRLLLSLPWSSARRLMELERQGATLSLALHAPGAGGPCATAGWTDELLALDRGSGGQPFEVPAEVLARNATALQAAGSEPAAVSTSRPERLPRPGWATALDN